MTSVSLSILSPCLFDNSTSYILKYISWQHTGQNKKNRTFLILNAILFFKITNLFISIIKSKKTKNLKNYHSMSLVIKHLGEKKNRIKILYSPAGVLSDEHQPINQEFTVNSWSGHMPGFQA